MWRPILSPGEQNTLTRPRVARRVPQSLILSKPHPWSCYRCNPAALACARPFVALWRRSCRAVGSSASRQHTTKRGRVPGLACPRSWRPRSSRVRRGSRIIGALRLCPSPGVFSPLPRRYSRATQNARFSSLVPRLPELLELSKRVPRCRLFIVLSSPFGNYCPCCAVACRALSRAFPVVLRLYPVEH